MKMLVLWPIPPCVTAQLTRLSDLTGGDTWPRLPELWGREDQLAASPCWDLKLLPEEHECPWPEQSRPLRWIMRMARTTGQRDSPSRRFQL